MLVPVIWRVSQLLVSPLSFKFCLFLLYALFISHGHIQGVNGDKMYEVDRNPAPTHLPKRGFFYISRIIVSDRLAFDKGVSLHTLGSEIAKSARPGFELTTYGSTGQRSDNWPPHSPWAFDVYFGNNSYLFDTIQHLYSTTIASSKFKIFVFCGGHVGYSY